MTELAGGRKERGDEREGNANFFHGGATLLFPNIFEPNGIRYYPIQIETGMLEAPMPTSDGQYLIGGISYIPAPADTWQAPRKDN